MTIVFAESQNGLCKKTAFEAVYFGSQLKDEMTVLITEDTSNGSELANYGANKVLKIKGLKSTAFDSQVFASAMSNAFEKLGGSTFVLAHSSLGKSIAGRVAVRLNAGLVSGANSFAGSNVFSKSVFSGKAILNCKILSNRGVISVMGNALKPVYSASTCELGELEVNIPASRVKIIDIKKSEGRVPLPEAEIVVSAGRGLKEPGNWGIIEDLAQVLGATTACSRPVADAGWRPHYEHVGQTGIAIRPNLYFAIGISGAIQHLAGVNNSKVIVVINKDPEAPFFKAGDYGVCGDLFEIVPKLTEAIRKFKAAHS